jgi:hypothetical protein
LGHPPEKQKAATRPEKDSGRARFAGKESVAHFQLSAGLHLPTIVKLMQFKISKVFRCPLPGKTSVAMAVELIRPLRQFEFAQRPIVCV